MAANNRLYIVPRVDDWYLTHFDYNKDLSVKDLEGKYPRVISWSSKGVLKLDYLGPSFKSTVRKCLMLVSAFELRATIAQNQRWSWRTWLRILLTEKNTLSPHLRRWFWMEEIRLQIIEISMIKGLGTHTSWPIGRFWDTQRTSQRLNKYHWQSSFFTANGLKKQDILFNGKKRERPQNTIWQRWRPGWLRTTKTMSIMITRG